MAVATGPATSARHLRVVRARADARRSAACAALYSASPGVLDEQPARRQRRDPDVLAVVAAEDAAREALVEASVLARAASASSSIGSSSPSDDEQRVLALADLGAQAIADRLEVVLRRRRATCCCSKKSLQVADVVGRQRARPWAAARAASGSAPRRSAGWPRGRASASPTSSSDRSPIRFCVRVSATTPGSLLGRSSARARLAAPAARPGSRQRPDEQPPTRTSTGCRVIQR